MKNKPRTEDFLPPMSSKIIALPHQFKGQLLYEKNSSCGALLIADEVGVGKTYSVGHILRSAVVSDMAKRILILCPARLVKNKWLPTMKQFGLSPVDCYSGKSLQRWLKGDLPRQVMISSYEKASGSGVNLEQFETDFSNGDYDEIDMVIIDEIHNFVQDAKNRIGLARIALNLSASRIGLTATPIWNGSKDFSEIIDLLQPDAMLENDVSKALKIQGKLSKLCFELYSESDDFSNTELLEEVASELGVEIEDICLDSAENESKISTKNDWLKSIFILVDSHHCSRSKLESKKNHSRTNSC